MAGPAAYAEGMGNRSLRFMRITNPFATPGSYASRSDAHGAAGHHTGIDFGKHLLPLVEIDGKPVSSATRGEVTISEYNSWAGNWVGVYFPGDDILITYWHMRDRVVEVGDHVLIGDVLGHVGSTGNSTAPHLHIQANHGREFDYHSHVHPARWVRGRWAGERLERRAERIERRARKARKA